MTFETTLFPDNPTHGMLFQQKNGVLYQYDTSIRSWLKLTSDNINLPLATSIKDGAMSSNDLKKLNRLLIPPPISSIVGNDCVAPYKRGNIDMYGGDQFVKVNGNLDIRNIDQFGDVISQEIPFQIHEHTYGFDFGLDVQQLVAELENRGQIRLVGKTGTKGDSGSQGDLGINGILSGPQGDVGDAGTAPACTISIEPESFQAQIKSGLKRALVNARIVPGVNDKDYTIEFDRQVVGNETGTAAQFHIKQIKSTWVLCVASSSNGAGTAEQCGVPGDKKDQYFELYYLDVEPIIDAIHDKFLSEVNRLKVGYEDIVVFWIQNMSDMFDEQKSALCCALERCMSLTKSISTREHMESVAAAAVGKAKISLHGRNSSESVEISSTRPLSQVGGADLCKSGPQFPKSNPETPVPAAPNPTTLVSGISTTVIVDPLINSSVSTAKHLELPSGEYVVTIASATAQINGLHRGNIKLRYVSGGDFKTIQFLDKGSFTKLIDSKSAYDGLSVAFSHDGGLVDFFLPSIHLKQVSGSIILTVTPKTIEIQKSVEPKRAEKSKKSRSKPKHKRSKPQVRSAPAILKETVAEVVEDPNQCIMLTSHLAWYESGWTSGRCCGVVINIGGQDYIIIKRSIGDEENCGGGEMASEPCISKFDKIVGHPAFAWPTFDGKTFAPLPSGDFIAFRFDGALNDLVVSKIESLEYTNPIGNPNGMRHLSHQLTVILFPVA